MDDYSLEITFCAGKATWYPDMIKLFSDCKLAVETGIFPKDGHFHDQDELFVEVFPFFVERWKHRAYYKVWADVVEFTPAVLNTIGKMISKMFGGK